MSAALLSAGGNCAARLWDAFSGAELRRIGHDGPVFAAASTRMARRAPSGDADGRVVLRGLPA